MKIIAIFLCTLMLLALIPLSASPYPSAFWTLNDKYIAAVEEGDDEGIVNYATQICALFDGRTDEIALNILSSRYYELGGAYERLGNYEASSDAYAKAIPYFDELAKYGVDTSESVTLASTKAMLYESIFEVYSTHYDYQTYYGAINEKRMGILYGVNHDGGIQERLTDDSLVLIYHSFGSDDTALIETKLKEAADDGCAVEFVLELPKEGAQIKDVLADRDHILKLTSLLDSADTPVFLIFGTEMDAWTVPCDPSDYVAAFRHVAKLVHESSDNIAMVWNPSCASVGDTSVHDFYPGDEYADWIGVSLYLQTHFDAQSSRSGTDRLALYDCFGGDAANPVKMLDELISVYGDRKPFIISETGVSHLCRESSDRTANTDLTSRAVGKLTMIYKYLPMAYPQIKAIAYLDRVASDSCCDFALSTNDTLAAAYLELVKDDAFIRNSCGDEANATYKKLTSTFSAEQGIIELRTMACFYGRDNVTLTYYIDGRRLASSSQLPYTVSVDLSAYAVGNHTLTVCAEESGELLGEVSCSIKLTKATDIYVNGELLMLPQKPVSVDGTILAPLRAIVERLGGRVEWINETREIIITEGDTVINLRIGSYDMIVNGVVKRLPVPARLINSTAYIPIRAVSEALCANVTWHGDTRSITVDK